MVSAERVLEYTQLPQEAAWIVGPNHPQTDPQTPRGNLRFTNLKLRYREGLNLALKGITFDVMSREKIGVVVGAPSPQYRRLCTHDRAEPFSNNGLPRGKPEPTPPPGSHGRREIVDGGRSVPTDRSGRSYWLLLIGFWFCDLYDDVRRLWFVHEHAVTCYHRIRLR